MNHRPLVFKWRVSSSKSSSAKSLVSALQPFLQELLAERAVPVDDSAIWCNDLCPNSISACDFIGSRQPLVASRRKLRAGEGSGAPIEFFLQHSHFERRSRSKSTPTSQATNRQPLPALSQQALN
jgi:hypothetical protein